MLDWQSFYSMCNSITFNQIQFSLTHTHALVCMCVCVLPGRGIVSCCLPARVALPLSIECSLFCPFYYALWLSSVCQVCMWVCECVCVRAEVSLYCPAPSLRYSSSLAQLPFECIAHSNALFENLLNTFCQGERFALCLPSAKKGCGSASRRDRSCQIKWEKEKQIETQSMWEKEKQKEAEHMRSLWSA